MEGGTQHLAEWHYQASSCSYSSYWNTTAEKPERAVRICRMGSTLRPQRANKQREA